MRLNIKNFEIALARKCWEVGDLAAAVGLSTSAITRYRTVDNLRPTSVGRIARALEVPVEEIVI